MHKGKQFIKTVLCLLLSAGLVCSDMPYAAFAAEGASETECTTEIQETEQTQEIQSEYNTDMETAESVSGETAAAQDGEKETESAEVTGAATEETKTEEAESEKTEPVPPEETSSTEIYTEETTQAPSTEIYTEETTQASSPEQMSETGTESVEETETETEETETVSETETETEAEVSVEKLVFSDSDIAHGEYKKDGNDITWVIDIDGKLTVEGTGDYAEPFDEKNLSNSLTRAPWYSKRDSITTAVIKVTGMKDSSAMLYNCAKLSAVDFSEFDTSNITNMEYMFCGCYGLSELDLSSFNTANVTSMRAMFSYTSNYTYPAALDLWSNGKLASIDLSSFDTGNVTDMRAMFAGCGKLASIDLSSFDTGNVTDMSYMFRDFRGSDLNLKLDLSNFNTENVTNMSHMFYMSSNIKELNVSNFNTGKVTDMSSMFGIQVTELDLSSFNTGSVTSMEGMFLGCSSLPKLDLSNFDTSNVVNMNRMFDQCESLTSLELGSFDMGNVKNVGGMFNCCESLKSVDFSKFDTSNMTTMGGMFRGWSGVTELDLSSFDTSKVTSMAGMFQGCSSLLELDLSNFDTSNVTDMSVMFNGCSSLPKLDLSKFDTSKVTDMGQMFWDCSSLQELNLSNFDTSNVTSMEGMFFGCSSVTELNLSKFDTSKVTEMENMFSGCSSLQELDLSNFDTGNVVSYSGMGGMFSGCSSLSKLDLSSFDTSNVTNMSEMFDGCSGLQELDLSSFDTGNVTGMGAMFRGCSKLTEIDVSGFDTSKVTNMQYMFSGCSNLLKLDLSSFDTSKVTYMQNMFNGCSSLPKLDLSSFDTSKVTDMKGMFKDCSSLTNVDLSGFDLSSVILIYSQDYCVDMLSGCSSLKQFYTPLNSKADIALEDTWYDIHGASYTTIPKGQTVSILLYRKIFSEDGGGHIFAQKKTTAFFCGDSLTVGDLTVIYYDKDGAATVLAQADYTTNAAQIDMNKAGEQTLTVTYKTPAGVLLTADILLTVKKRFDDACVAVTLPDADSYSYTYNGKGKKPEPTVMYTAGEETVLLTKKTDYVLSYKNNVNAYRDSADTAENAPAVIITGRGIYGGQVVKNFEIQKAAAPENEELTQEYTYFSRPQNVYIYCSNCFNGYKKVSCTVGTPVENDEISGSVLAGTPTMNSSMNQLTCSLNAGTAGDFVTIPVTFSFDNYEDAVLNVKIVFTGTPTAEKKKVTISGIEISDRVYNKTPAAYTGTAKAVSETDNADVTGSVTFTYTYSGTQADGSAYAASSNAPVNAGRYKLTVTVAQDDKNYTGSAEYPFTIAKAPLTITARDMGLKIGAELPKAEDYQFDMAGLLEGDTLITNPTLSCSIADTVAAGEYDITVSGADAGMNYDITYKNGTLTVSETGETAKYYTVIFNLSGKGSDITNTGVKEGSLLEQPREPQAEGYIFTGWYKDQACTVRWDFATDTVQTDTVIYAGWKKKDADNEEDASWHISEIAPMVYTGNAIKPAVMVYDSDGTLMKAGTHYTIAYKNNTDADKVAAAGGTRSTENGSTDGFHEALPHVIITGKGDYTGSIYKNFHIYPASISNDGETPAKGFTLKYTEQFVTANKEQKPFASIKYKKAMTIGKDYDIAFSKYAVDGSLQEITSGSAIPAISANDAGTFKLVITGKGNFSGAIEKDIYVGSKDSLMKNAKITIGKDIKSVPYTGDDIEPKASGENGADVFTVKFGSKFLTPETDYTVSYRNNRAAGTAAIIVKGKGQYIGTKTAAFTIKGTPFKAKDAAIKNFEVSWIYTGSAIEQGRDGVTIGGKTLNYGTDYTVAYKNNVKKGTATVTFVANPESGFSGSFNKTFKIVAADLAQTSTDITFTDYTVTGSGAGRKLSESTSYSKAGAKPSGSFVLRDNNGNILRQGTDYTVSYTNNKKANTDAVMTIKGKGNYTGQITISYTVSKAALDKNANLTQSCTPVRYNEGKPDDYLYKPKFKVLDGNKALAAKSDYKALTDTSYINCTQDKVTAYLAALESGTVTGDALEAMRPCVEITAADNGSYAGSRKVYLTVYKTKLTNRNIKVEITDKTDIYTGTQVRPQVTVRYNDNNGIIDLVEGRDYTLTYGANIAAGKNKGSVTVNGTGLYGGSVTTKFTIQSKDVNKK